MWRAIVLIAVLGACGNDGVAHAGNSKPASLRPRANSSAAKTRSPQGDVAAYSGTDARGIPRYFRGQLNPEARRVLRQAFGIVSPSHLYISDSTEDALLKYDPQVKPCLTCYVNSYRIGFVSVRRKGESWDDLQQRVRSLNRRSFPPSSLVTSSSVSAMDPDIQGEVTQMLDAARRAGFQLHIVSTYRSTQQEALLMSEGGGRTHTLTSLHSYGRAIDLRVGDGNLASSSTRRSWIAFRSWVTRFRGTDFRILGKPDRSWDWPHVELPSDKIGFRSVDAAVAAGRSCLSLSSPHACEFVPHLSSAR